MSATEDTFRAAARAVSHARALVIAAGAGAGVDSGLPDFRGPEGFWRAYPMYRSLGLSFEEAANPGHFQRDPELGWGFYGHRLGLYRKTVPHAGFGLLLEWGRRYGLDTFVVTSNVDGQFQKAGFPSECVSEIHGSIHYLQCLAPCSDAIWENTEDVPVEERTMRARSVPRCPRCGQTARPNILMFGDWSWVADRSHAQAALFEKFVRRHAGAPMVVLEMGAGTSIPSIRHLSEGLGARAGCLVVRVNPREPQIRGPHLSLAVGALEGVRGIESALVQRGT